MATSRQCRARLFVLHLAVMFVALRPVMSSAADADAPAARLGLVDVGVAAVDITPDYPVRLNGFGFRRAESEGVNQKLYAKALAIGADADQPFILFTIDNLGITDAIAEEVAARLKKRAGIDRARIAFTATHTHTAPMLKGLAPTLFGAPIPPEHQANIDKYTAQFTDWLEEAAVMALKDRKPATLHWAIGVAKFAANRRTKGGPVDHDLPVLIAKSDGKVRAVFANYACHCVTLSHNKLGGDWAGYAQAAMQEQFPGAIALVGIGCGADANPSSGVTGDKTDIAAAQGKQIADEVARLLTTPMNALTAKPAATFNRIDLPLDKPRTKEEWETRAKQQGAVGYHAKVNLDRLARGEKLPEKISYPVQTWAFGDQLAMVFLPGEVVVDYSLRLKRELDGHRLWINAYANAAPCYIPSERILKEGGYEGGDAMIYYDLPQRLAPGVEKLVVDEVHRQMPDVFNAKFDGTKTDGSRPMTPQQSLAAMRVTEGYKVELVASEPLIDSPVAIEFGTDGRLWVAEMRDYPMGMDGNYKPGGRIKVLEDTDGDGRFDKATVFLDDLPYPTGVTVWRKGVIVCAAPDVIYAEDTDGDGKADVKRTLLAGFATHNYQARVNSLRYGLDNWMYAAAGLFGGKIRSFNGTEIDLTNRDFRFKPDTGEIEAVAGQSQHGRIRSDWGDWFGCDSGTLLKHYPFEDRHLKRNPNVTPPPMTVRVADADPYRVYPISDQLQLFKLSGAAGGITSACGAEIYRDTLLDRIQGQEMAFVCEPVNLVVHRMHLMPRGATFIGMRDRRERTSEFLASTDTWFRPVEARTGPDGALWVTDMYRYVIEHPRWIPPERVAQIDVRAGSGMGRIYRVVLANQKPRDVPRLDKLNAVELVSALENPSGVVRDRAQQLLIWGREKSAIPFLRQLLKTSTRAEARLHALCTLAAMDALDNETLIHTLDHNDRGVRLMALRLCEGRVADSRPLLDAILRIKPGSPVDSRIPIEIALRLGETKEPVAGEALVTMLQHESLFPHLTAAMLLAMPPHLNTIVRTLNAQTPPADPNGDPDRNTHLIIQRTLRDNAQWHRSTVKQLVRLAVDQRDDEVIAQLLSDLMVPRLDPGPSGPEFETAVVLIDALAAQKRTVDDWYAKAPASARKLVKADTMERLYSQAVNAAERDTMTDTRIAAIELLSRHPAAGEKYFDVLVDLLRTRHGPQVQQAALAAITRVRDDRVPTAALKDWSAYGPAMRAAVLNTIVSREAWALAILKDSDKHGDALKLLSPAQRQALATHPSPAVRELAAKAFGQPAATDKAKLLEQFKTVATTRGDAARGREVFTKNCAACHQLHTVGKPIAPNLAALTDRTPTTLLTAILDPSRDVLPQYVGYRIESTDDETITGMITEESSTAIVVAQLDGTKRSLPRNQLVSMTTTGLSLMPQGLEQAIDAAAMADLFAFINLNPAKPKVFEGNKPEPVKAAKDNTLTLPATAAEIYGKEIAFEPPNKNIGFWHGNDDHVAWSAEVAAAGTYDVALEWSCAEASAGSAFVIDIGGQLVRGVAASTGGWDKFTTKIVGRVKLPAAEIRVTVKPDGPLKTPALMDLRAVKLTPAKPKVYPGNKPELMKSRADGSLALPASAAEIHGGDIDYEEGPKAIGMWHGEHDHAAWSAELAAAGEFDVALEWSCAPNSAGSPFVIDFGGQLVRGVIASTGAWNRFETKTVGRVKLPAGKLRVVVRPDGPLKTRALMDLRSVTLTPVKAK